MQLKTDNQMAGSGDRVSDSARRCFRDQDSLRKSLGGQNLMGLRGCGPLPKFRHSLRQNESECDGFGLQEGILKQTNGWTRLQRPCGQWGQFHQRSRPRKSRRLEQGGMTMADGAVAGGCSGPLGNCIWALAVLSRARLTLVVTWRSQLDGMARLEALPKFWA